MNSTKISLNLKKNNTQNSCPNCWPLTEATLNTIFYLKIWKLLNLMRLTDNKPNFSVTDRQSLERSFFFFLPCELRIPFNEIYSLLCEIKILWERTETFMAWFVDRCWMEAKSRKKRKKQLTNSPIDTWNKFSNLNNWKLPESKKKKTENFLFCVKYLKKCLSGFSLVSFWG